MKHIARSLALLAFASFLLAALPGCQCWNAWLDLWKWPMPEDGQNAAVANDNRGTANTAITAVVPRVIVHRITAPIGTFSTNEKVWNELDENAIDSKTSVLMAQNGLRAGIASVSRWPHIAKLIDGPGVTSDQTRCQTDGRNSLSIMTRQGIAEQIVVSIDRDLQMKMRTSERCDNGFKLSLRGIRGKPQLQVSIEPFVLLGTVTVHRTDRELGITGRGFTSEENFPDLQMSAALTADQFLLISCVDPKSNKFSIGSQWLADTETVPAVETVIIFVPDNPGPQPSGVTR